MLIRWLFRFVALFLGRQAWEAFQRRRTTTRRTPGSYRGTAARPTGKRRAGRGRTRAAGRP
jgi:hypothetical protein